MAGTKEGMQIFQEQYYSGKYEVLQQEANAFNEASRNAIRLVTQSAKGDFLQEAFFDLIPNMYKRRDITSIAVDTDDALTSSQLISPKVNRKYQVANTLDSFKKINSDMELFSFILGQKAGKAKAVDYLNTALLAGVAAINSNAEVRHVVDGPVTHEVLIDGLAKYGDAASEIVLWVMRSGQSFKLMKDQLDIATDRVAGATIYEASVGTLNRRTLVTDSPSLIASDSPGQSYILGLTENGLAILESEDSTVYGGIESGLKNLIFRVQGEDAYNVSAKGYAYTHATANPDSDELGSSANWEKRVYDSKSTAGVIIRVNN